MTKCEYLTARCPYGCEVWLHPKAVVPHAGRCRGIPWTESRRPVTEVLLANEDADDARTLLPSSVLAKPEISGDRLLNPRPGMRLHDSAVQGIVVRSPLDGVTGRRWWTVARAAIADGRSIEPAFCTDGFAALERLLELEDHFVRCDVCGDDMTARGLRGHQRSNSVCRFLSDVAEVRTFWELGYRDPFSLRDEGVPITWTELSSRAHWRNRTHIIRFRLWTAVLYRRPKQC